MKHTLPLLFAVTMVLCLSFTRNNGGTNNNTSFPAIEPDTVFLSEAASSSLMEIEVGKLAQERAASEDVKRFGAMMVKDHTLATEELKKAAAAINFTPPQTVLPKHGKHLDHLNGIEGPDFDKAYMEMMVEAHKEDIDEFEDAAKKAKDAGVRAFAAKQLPVLKMHRDSAQAISKRIR